MRRKKKQQEEQPTKQQQQEKLQQQTGAAQTTATETMFEHVDFVALQQAPQGGKCENREGPLQPNVFWQGSFWRREFASDFSAFLVAGDPRRIEVLAHDLYGLLGLNLLLTSSSAVC